MKIFQYFHFYAGGKTMVWAVFDDCRIMSYNEFLPVFIMNKFVHNAAIWLVLQTSYISYLCITLLSSRPNTL